MIFASFLEIFISDILSFYVSLPISLMVLIYWNMALPRSVGLLWALLAGFTLDIAQEIYLGSHVFYF
jgi:rod shape-determining protein MreD